jgi:hypothetical protein
MILLLVFNVGCALVAAIRIVFIVVERVLKDVTFAKVMGKVFVLLAEEVEKSSVKNVKEMVGLNKNVRNVMV